MKRLKSILGYTAASLTLVAAVLVPFLLIDVFQRGIAATGVRINPAFTGGEPLYTVDKGGYRIEVGRPVRPVAPLERRGPFVQLRWTPAAALPAHISEEIDIDRDGTPDALVTFDVPKDAGARLHGSVKPLTGKVIGVNNLGRDSFSSIIARVGDGIVVRLRIR